MSPYHIPLLMGLGIAINYLLKGKNLKLYHKFSELVKIIAIDLMFPVFLFSALCLGKTLSNLKAFFLAVIFPLISLIAGYFLFKGDENFKEGLILSFFGNITIFGIPIIKALNLPETIALVAVNGYNLVYIPISAFIATLDPKDLVRGFKKAISSSILLAFFLALILKFIEAHFHLHLIENFSHLLRALKKLTEPSLYLMAIYFGLKVEFGAMNWKFALKVFLAKILVPVAFYLPLRPVLGKFIPMDMLNVIIILSSMPPAILANAFISQFGLNEEISYSTTLLLTVLSLLWLIVKV